MESEDESSDLAFSSLSRTPSQLSCISISSVSCYSSPSPRLRLSSCVSDANRAVPAPRRELAWISLQNRLIGAEEASCAKMIGDSLSLEESIAWDMFSPLQRVLVVAIVAAATSNGEKSRQISQLQKSVNIRDMVLAGMQQKLDDLCDHMNYLKDEAKDCGEMQFISYEDYSEDDSMSNEGKIKICEPTFELNPLEKVTHFEPVMSTELKPIKEDIFISPNPREPEERRMSDLSYCSSITSSADIQLSALAAEQDSFNLRRECDEKDGIIKALTVSANELRIASSKRISDLEDVIRRKNMVINKMKKDMLILEQKLIQFTRQRRPSYPFRSSEMNLPVMAANLLYDMSSSSPSSSDSESSDTCMEKASSHGCCLNTLPDMIGASLDGHVRRTSTSPRRWL